MSAPRVSRQKAQDRDTPHHLVADSHADLGAARHVAVGSGAEANHTEPFAGGELVAGCHPTDDPPGDDTRDLDDGHPGVLTLEVEHTALVHVARVPSVGGHEAASRVR